MVNTRCVASKKDYDCYTMHLPVSVILHNRKNKYIFNQLEKLHPCFSKNHCYKTRLNIRKKGFYSDVIVMDSRIINEYKTKYPNKKIWINDVQDTFEDFGKKRYLIRIFILLFSLLLLSGISYLSLHFYLNKTIPVNETLAEESDCIPFRNLLEDLFSVVEQKNGKIRNLQCSLGLDQINFEANLESIFPEDLNLLGTEVSVKNIVYSDGNPSAFVSYGKMNANTKTSGLSKSQMLNIRNILFENDAILLKEDSALTSFSFTLENGYEHFIVFQKIQNFLNQENCTVSKLKINSGDNQTFHVDVSFCKGEEGINVESFYAKKNLFKLSKKSVVEVPKKQITVINEQKKDEMQKKNSLVLIGEITKADGVKIYFYKNEAGKIFKEVKEEK